MRPAPERAGGHEPSPQRRDPAEVCEDTAHRLRDAARNARRLGRAEIAVQSEAVLRSMHEAIRDLSHFDRRPPIIWPETPGAPAPTRQRLEDEPSRCVTTVCHGLARAAEHAADEDRLEYAALCNALSVRVRDVGRQAGVRAGTP